MLFYEAYLMYKGTNSVKRGLLKKYNEDSVNAYCRKIWISFCSAGIGFLLSGVKLSWATLSYASAAFLLLGCGSAVFFSFRLLKKK